MAVKLEIPLKILGCLLTARAVVDGVDLREGDVLDDVELVDDDVVVDVVVFFFR